MNKKLLLTSVMSIAMLASITTGATYALFTAESVANVNVTAAKVQVEAVAENFKTFSGEWNGTEYESVENEGLVFSNGGFYDSEKNTITNITPMDKITFDLKVKNTSNVKIKYQALISSDKEEDKLFDNLIITINGKEVKETEWEMLNIGEEEVVLPVTIELPMEAGNELQGETTTLVFKVSAVQGNANVVNPTEDNNTIYIYNEKELREFADSVNSGTNYKGQTVKLMSNIDLGNDPWTPIGPNADASNKFQGTFDGNNKTISNLYVKQEAGYHAAGFFGALNGTVKDFKINGAYIENLSSGSATDNGTAVVAGSIYSSGKIDNVDVKNVEVKGNRYVGGISGYTYGSVINCDVESAVLTATPDDLTGSYDNGDKVGGIAGYFESESTYTVSNNTVTNLTLTGYRDLGGIVGAGKTKAVLNNSVSASKITADQSVGYYGDKEFNVDYIVGRKLDGAAVDSSNTYSSTTATALLNVEYDGNDKVGLEDSINNANGNVEIVVPKDKAVTWTTGAETDSTPFKNNGDVTIIGSEDGGSKFIATGAGVGAISTNVAENEDATLTLKNLTIVDESVSYAENSWEFTYLEFAGNVVFENCNIADGIMVTGKTATFINCKFTSDVENEYAVWVDEGNAYFEGCSFTGYRGIKIHEAYGTNIDEVIVDDCEFNEISEKPGVAIGTLDSTTKVEIKNSTFINCEIYESDTNENLFSITLDNNETITI